MPHRRSLAVMLGVYGWQAVQVGQVAAVPEQVAAVPGQVAVIPGQTYRQRHEGSCGHRGRLTV